MIRPVNIDDAEALLGIYNYYVEHSAVTFDLEPISIEAFKSKIALITANYPFIVFEDQDEILGYAYGSQFRPRPAYRFTVESTVYVKHNVHGRQIGSKLYKVLLELLKEGGFHVVIGVLTLPNTASEKLHERFGFRLVGHFKELGLKFDSWHDIGLYQLMLQNY